MSEQRQKEASTTLVIGGTGDLGGRVVRQLLAHGKAVRALVRDGTDASPLTAQGVDVVRGDMLEPASLDRALEDVSALVTTAKGYMGRRKGDSLVTVDDRGNRNLIDAAARSATLECFVFTSVLTADKARTVPQFWQKKVIEDYLEASGVPFVALRPGAFIGAAHDFWAKDLKKGRLTALGKADVPVSSVHIEDVADCLARAVDQRSALGQRVDIGMDRALSFQDLADLFSSLLDRHIKLRTIPWTPVNAAMKVGGRLQPRDSRLPRLARLLLHWPVGGRHHAAGAALRSGPDGRGLPAPLRPRSRPGVMRANALIVEARDVQKCFLTRHERGTVVRVDLAGRLFNRVPALSK